MNPIIETLLTIIAAVVVGIPTAFILYTAAIILWDRMKPVAPRDPSELLHRYALDNKVRGYKHEDRYRMQHPHPTPYARTSPPSYSFGDDTYSFYGNEEWGDEYRVYIRFEDFRKWRDRKFRGRLKVR